jgi:tetratricopeptide (TPR) repeat protein
MWRLEVPERPGRLQAALEGLFHFFSLRSRARQGIELFGQALALPGLPAEFETGLRMYRGTLYQQDRQADPALQDLQAALETARRTSSRPLQARCLLYLARNAAITHRKTAGNVMELLDEAAALADGEPAILIQALYYRGSHAGRQGDPAGAIRHLEESIRLAREQKAILLLFPALNSLGDSYCYEERFDQALACFEECLELSKALQAPYQTALHLNNIATVYHSQERFEPAARYYRMSLEICLKIDDLEGAATALSNLGELALLQKQDAEAEKSFNEALALAEKSQSQWMMVVIRNNLVKIALRAGEREKAARTLVLAGKGALASGTVSLMLHSLYHLGILLEKQDPERSTRAIRLAAGHPSSEPDVRAEAKAWLGAHQAGGEENSSPETLLMEMLELI